MPTLILPFIAMLLALFITVHAPSANAQPEASVNLALENADIKELVRWASDHVEKNIILHPKVSGKVTVIAGEPMTSKEAYDVFLSVLQVHGFAVVETTDALKVVPSNLANESSAPLLSSETATNADDVVVRILKIRNVAANQLVALLKPMMPKEALLTAYPDSNLLIISDRAANINRIVRIVGQIDRAGLIDIELIRLKYASAKDVIQIITQLVQPSNAGGAQGFTIAEDARSNSILMTGNPIIRDQLRGLIGNLDQPLSGDGNTQVVFVNFADAKSLVPILRSVSGSVQKADRDQTFQHVDVKIEVSEPNNALVITAPPSLLDTMKGVIETLDVRRPQVLVEAIIVEVNDDILRDMGVEWFSDDNRTFTGIGALPNSLTTPAPPNFGEGLTFGFFRDGELRALMRALEADTEANVLSTPTIVALDNEEAEILVGSNVPFVTGQATNSASSTENPFQTIQRQDIGVSLKVKPRINRDQSITLEVEQAVETISPATASDIVTSKREIKTKVLIENGEVLVLGGLIDDRVDSVERGVPLLRSLPIVGRAFKSTKTQVTKNNLMVFIHPVILNDRRENESATKSRYERFRDLQHSSRSSLFQIPRQAPLLEEWPAADVTYESTP
ncbi:MAG: type II secretion system secretin GspD [Pseudomonadota bacterium]